MSQDTARIQDVSEQSPVMLARHKLGLALEQLETTVLARMEEAARLAEDAAQNDSSVAEEWQNACRTLEEQLAALQDENSLLRGELQTAQTRNADLETANAHALQALDDAIAQVEQMLKG